MHKNTKLAIFGLLVAGGVFGLDLAAPLGGISATLYVLLVLISLLSTDTMFTVWATIIATVLIAIGIWYHGGADMPSGALINHIFALVIMWLTSILSLQRKEVERELRELNLNLELKVLARTAASENKSRRLEQQIKILESIYVQEKEDAFKALDDVINNLRDLKDEEEEELEDLDIDVEYLHANR